MMSGRLALAKKKNDELLLRMQFFCLDPKKINFDEICGNGRLAAEQSDYMGIWKMAAIHQYGEFWDYPSEDITKNKAEFEAELKRLYARLLVRPTSMILDKMWFVFFATGDINALENAFGVSGNESASKDIRNAASDQFAHFRDEYRRRINEALGKDPHYFRNHETVCGSDDAKNPMLQTKTAFDRFQKKLDDATQKLKEMEDGEEELIGKFTHQGHENSDSENDDTDDDEKGAVQGENGDENNEKMLKLSNRFDQIAKDVLGNKYVTKPSG
jgi:hypothetical protein